MNLSDVQGSKLAGLLYTRYMAEVTNLRQKVSRKIYIVFFFKGNPNFVARNLFVYINEDVL